MNVAQVLMELQMAAARVMRAPLKGESRLAVVVDQEVRDAMPHIYRVAGAKRQGRGGRRPVFQRQSNKCEE